MTMTLEPCPFCGGKAKVDHDSWYGWWQTGCTECGCKISEVECYSEADAIAAWNRRTHPAQPAQTVVTDAVVQRAEQAFWPAYSECTRVHGARKNAHATGMRAALLAVWPKPPAMQDDWRIAFFERWREAAHEKGYAGVAEAITAAPTAFLHGTAPAFAQPAVTHGEMCKICGKDTPHYHLLGTTLQQVRDYLARRNTRRFSIEHPIDAEQNRQAIRDIDAHITQSAQLVDVEKVREVIAHLRQFDNPYMRGLADKLEAALPESKP